MDQPVKSPAQLALEDAFERMFELSRSAPAPTLAERLDRLARLRAAIQDNESRFEQAISADFGHRSRIETAIAETLLVLGEIKHAWLVPQLAMQRDGEGNFVMVVGADGKVVQKHVTTDRIEGSNWIVTGGIDDGDQIVVSGLQKLKPGAPAKATPWQPAPAQPAAAAPAAH